MEMSILKYLYHEYEAPGTCLWSTCKMSVVLSQEITVEHAQLVLGSRREPLIVHVL